MLPSVPNEQTTITFVVFCIPRAGLDFFLSKVRWLGTLQKAQLANKFHDLLLFAQTHTASSAKPCQILFALNIGLCRCGSLCPRACRVCRSSETQR